VEEDPYLVFILHKRVYGGIRARTMRLATSGATAAQASAAGSSYGTDQPQHPSASLTADS
jgi:hypothetical protein